MNGFRLPAAALAFLVLTCSASAQPLEIAPLPAPDMFSPDGRDTGLPADLWRGASAPIVRTVIPLLATQPLSPAGAALARRILATGARAPDGVGDDAALAGLRAAALINQGDLPAAARILSRTSGLERDSDLSKAAAEAALLSRDDERACAIADGLGVGRGDIYWLRLRAFCLARAGDAGAARLTFDLAQAKTRDAAYGRMMGAKLTGGAGGPPVLRNGLDYALARDLGLDLTAADAAPSVAAAMNPTPAGEATWAVEPGPGDIRAAMTALGQGNFTLASLIRTGLVQTQISGAGADDLLILDAALAAAQGQADVAIVNRLVERGVAGDQKARPRAQTAALYLAALGAPVEDGARGVLAGFPIAAGAAPAPRVLALQAAAEAGRMGETALVALWIAADAAAAGPAPGDRAQIIKALDRAGLKADARAYAVEGLLAAP